MRILALEPYYGGSHRAFLDSWIAGSRHAWTLLTLPPFKWKWRMRHSAITLAAEARRRSASGDGWDAIFASDMLDLAQFRGLAPPAVRDLPAVSFFHENQLTYPVQVEKERDLHFALTNLTTALAADAVWFNSAFHRQELLEAIPRMLRRMPDHQPWKVVDTLRRRSRVEPPGIDPAPHPVPRRPRPPGPLRILWAARWEHDKNPETFFRAIDLLHRRGTAYRLSVIGERFRRVPEVFAEARVKHRAQIDRWGYLASRKDYAQTLVEADVLVSTALHEFFGVSVVEAVAAGAFPLLPQRLSYPELLSEVDRDRRADFFYDGSADQLADRLAELAGRAGAGDLWRGDPACAGRAVERFFWSRRRPELDDALESAREASRATRTDR